MFVYLWIKTSIKKKKSRNQNMEGTDVSDFQFCDFHCVFKRLLKP